MAENAPTAFGKYLRALRERRGLSLQDVVSLSRSSVEPVNKGYLSRCENGHQKLAFAKIISLSHLYEVPADVLVERMELDLELDRVGGPETEGLEFKELATKGGQAINQGWKWTAYGYLRDAVVVARASQLSASFADYEEQECIAIMNVATVASALRKSTLALHELHFVNGCDAVTEQFQPLVLERLGNAYLCAAQLGEAREYTDQSVSLAESSGESEYLGYYYSARALVASEEKDFELALDLYKRAYSAYKSGGQDPERATTLNNLAQLYFNTGRYGSAKRALENSSKLAVSLQLHRARGLGQLLRGEIDELEHRPLLAKRRWRKTIEIAKQIKDLELRFKAEYLLLRRASRDQDAPVFRSIERRLIRLAPWVHGELPELKEFRIGLGSKQRS